MTSAISQSTTKPRPLRLSWLKGKWGFLGILFILYIFFDLSWTYFHWGGTQNVILIADLLSFTPSLLAIVVSWRVAAQKSLNASLRRAWLLFGMSFLTFLLGNVIWTYLEVVLQTEPFPSLADVFYIAGYPLTLWGLLSLPSAPQSRRAHATFWLDLLSVLTAAIMFVGHFIIVPTALSSGNDLLIQILASAYPISSLFLVGGILAILYRQLSPDIQSALNLVFIGMVFFLGGDFAFGYTSLTGTYSPGGWTDTSWNVAQLFFALAALRQMYHSPASSFTRRWVILKNKFTPWLPLLAISLSYGLVFYVTFVNYSREAEWLMAGALLLTLLSATRQIISPAFGDLPIRIKAIVTLTFVSAVSVSLVTLASYLVIRPNLESTVGSNLKIQAQAQAQAVSNLITKQVDVMEGFVLSRLLQHHAVEANLTYSTDSSIAQAELEERNQAWETANDRDALVQIVLKGEGADHLNDFLERFPSHTELLLTDKYGGVIAATVRPTNYDQSTQEWWQAAYAQKEGAIYIGPLTRDEASGQTHIVIAIPVRDQPGKEVLGILQTVYTLHDLTQLLADRPGLTGEFDLLLPTGHLLRPEGDLVSLDPETTSALKNDAQTVHTLLDLMGTPQLISQAPITSPDPEEARALEKLDWTLIVRQDPATAFAPINAALRIALLTTLIVLLLTTGVAVILAQVMIAPISRLTRAAAQIAAGDLTTNAQVESLDEIGVLASTFNMMVQTLSLAERGWKESEALYRRLVDYFPDMISVHRHGRYIFINPAGVSLLGAQSADELIGRPVLDVIPMEEQEFVRRGIEQTQAGEEPTPLLERKIRRLDGKIIQVELKAIPILYAGEPAIQTVMRDITERKQAEEQVHQLLVEVEAQKGDLERRVTQRTEDLNSLNARLQNELTERQHLVQSLQESEQRFRLVFDASPDAFFLIDPHACETTWKIIDCNQAACQMNGYTREELIGQPIDLLNEKKGDPNDFAIVLENLRNKGVVRGLEAYHRHKDGHAFPIEYSTSLITIGNRELVLGIDREITERKHSEAVLREAKETAEESRRVAEAASRAKSEFLSRMSHELRTPMNAILGFAQLLGMSRKEPLSSVQNDRVRQIVKGGQHLLDLINEILDISRIEAGRLQVSPEPVPVRESIQEAIDLTIPLAVKRHIQLQSKLAFDANPYVLADRQRFKQVLLNLLGNAVKYNRDDGFVVVTCESTQADGWRISIRDTGIGISSENVARLFTPFERLAADQSTVEGTGLGLALAKRLIELMKGRIGVESVLGQGSTFWIELPSAESPLARLQRTGGPVELPAMSAAGRTILYVEDNIANFELMQQVLADYIQIKLLWATDPQTGIELARQHQPSLILLDLHLGVRDGTEALQQLKQNDQTKNIPVIVVSADATPGPFERCMSLGAHAYLTKPLDVKRFVQLLEGLLSEEN